MTAAERTRDAALAFLGLVLLLLALDAFARLSLDPEGRDRLLLWTCAGGAARPPRGGGGPLPPARPAAPAVDRAASPRRDVHRPERPRRRDRPPRPAPPRRARRARRRLGRGPPRRGARRPSRGTGRARVLRLEDRVPAPRGGGALRRGRLPEEAARLPLVLAAAAAALLGTGVLAVRLLPRGGAIASGGLVSRLGAALSARDFSSFANHRVMFWRTAFEMTATSRSRESASPGSRSSSRRRTRSATAPSP